MKPHKWAKEIKAWADGHEIEYRDLTCDTDWATWVCPSWDNDCYEYRIKPQPHKHQALIDAHKAGVEIQVLSRDGTWGDCSPSKSLWFDDSEYRIKPQPKEPQYAYAWLDKGIEEVVWFCDKPSGILEDNMHKYIGKIKLETDDE